jgi:hypothetical protein
MTPCALVVIRVPHGAAAPEDATIRAALVEDRIRLRRPPAADLAYRLAGPYLIQVDGRSLDEYVAWEI